MGMKGGYFVDLGERCFFKNVFVYKSKYTLFGVY